MSDNISQHMDAAERVAKMLEADLMEVPPLETLSKAVALSPFQLSRLFNAHHGETIPARVRRLRMDRAAEMMAGEGEPKLITEIAAAVGYKSLSAFVRAFSREKGKTPTEYRSGVRSSSAFVPGGAPAPSVAS